MYSSPSSVLLSALYTPCGRLSTPFSKEFFLTLRIRRAGRGTIFAGKPLRERSGRSVPASPRPVQRPLFANFSRA